MELLVKRLAGGSLAASFFLGCSLLIDFDELEGPTPSANECADCQSQPACTRGRCTENGCLPDPNDDPRCTDAGSLICTNDSGPLTAATDFAPLEAAVIYKTQLLATEHGMYHVAHIDDGEHQDVVVRLFNPGVSQPSETLRLSDRLSDGRSIAGPAALVGPTANDPSLTLYVALKRAEESLAVLERVNLSPELDGEGFLSLTPFPNYLPEQPGPAAGRLSDGSPFVIWHGCRTFEKPEAGAFRCPDDDAALFEHSGNAPKSAEAMLESGIARPGAVAGLVALGGGKNPAAAWLAATADGTENRSIAVSMGAPGLQLEAAVRVCHAQTGFAPHALHATPLVGERSSISWSKLSNDGFVAEATAVYCRSDGCVDTGRNDDAACSNEQLRRRVLPNVRALARASLTPSNDVEGLLVAVWSETVDGESSVKLQLQRGYSDPNRSAAIQDAPLAQDVLATAQQRATAPDDPVVAVLPPVNSAEQTEVLAVGWTQPGAASDTAHFRSFHLCPQ